MTLAHMVGIVLACAAVVAMYCLVQALREVAARALLRAYHRGYAHGYTAHAIAEQLAQTPEDGPLEFRAETDQLAASAVIIEQGCRLPIDD